MPESDPQSGGSPPAAAIVQLPPSWRQTFDAAIGQRDLSLRMELIADRRPSDIHPLRRRDLQAEQTLAFAAEAAHRSRSAGCAIVCDESSERVSVMIAAHDERRTELHGWNRSDRAESIEYVLFLLEQWNRHAPEIRGHAPQSRFVIDRRDLFADDDAGPLWLLSHDQRFQAAETIDAAGVLSGSFHPLHAGHRKMRAAAQELIGESITYEMTLQNADKPPLDWLTLYLRSRQFIAGELLLTRAPTFGEKAELLPGATFVVGWDTAVRVLERRFYPAGRLEFSLEKIAGRGSRFLVAARRDAEGLRTLDELTIPGRFRDLFSAIPPELFEEDISSTSIREAWLRGESETGPPGLFRDSFKT